jgi:hypothetical protein
MVSLACLIQTRRAFPRHNPSPFPSHPTSPHRPVGPVIVPIMIGRMITTFVLIADSATNITHASQAIRSKYHTCVYM